MSKTVFITGASSGIGKATADLFLSKGWNVVATMRSPEKQRDFTLSDKLLVLPLDVTNKSSISKAIAEAITHFNKIDVVVNNAGFGLLGPLENATDEQIKTQFDTNLIGLIHVTKEFIPHFKGFNGGTFINISSMLGKITLPFFSLYASSKFAVEGFSEALRYELHDYNVKIKLVEPGTIKTNFNKSEELTLKDLDQNPRFKKVIEGINKKGAQGTEPKKVAEVIYKAATDKSNKLRYVPDQTARFLLTLRSLTPINLFQFIMSKTVG
jgi:short-subunit dehydrogenase